MSYYTLNNLSVLSDEYDIAEEFDNPMLKIAMRRSKSRASQKKGLKDQKKYFSDRLAKCHSEQDIEQLGAWIEKQRRMIQRKLNGTEIQKKDILQQYMRQYDEFERQLNSMNIAQEKLSTRFLDNPKGKTMVLYHGSDKKFDYVRAGTINMGNRLEPKHLSSFWTNTYGYAVVYAFDWMCIETEIPYTHDLSDTTIVIPKLVNSTTGESVAEFMKREINKRPLYVYEAEIPVKYIGRGHVPINEYTVDRDVIPRKATELKWKDVKKYVKFVTQDEFNELYGKYTFSKGNLNWKEKLVYRNPEKTLANRKQDYDFLQKRLTNKRRLFYNKPIQSK